MRTPVSLLPARPTTGLPALILSLLLSACGGGGGGGSNTPPPTPASPAGWWSGSTNNGQPMKALVLSDGSYYLYTTASGSNTPADLVYGQGSATSSQFSDPLAHLYRLSSNSTLNAQFSASYLPQQRFDGSVSSSAGSFSWTGTWDSANAGSASTGAISGSYVGVWAGLPVALPAVFTVLSNGQFGGLTGTCVFNGRLTPRSDVNAYDFSLSFNGLPCTSPNQDFQGIAYYDSNSRSLYAVSHNTAQDSAALLAASKP